MENDFILNGKDYTNLIQNTQDFEDFQRLKWLCENELHKPARECIEYVIEAVRIQDRLARIPERKIIVQNSELN